MKQDTKDKKLKSLKLSRRRTREDIIAEREKAKAATEPTPQEPEATETPAEPTRTPVSESKPKSIPLPASKKKEPKRESPKAAPPPAKTKPPLRERNTYGPALGVPPTAKARPTSNSGSGTTPSQLDSFDPNDPFGDILPKSPTQDVEKGTGSKQFSLKSTRPPPRTKPPMPLMDGPNLTSVSDQPSTKSPIKPPSLPNQFPPKVENASAARLEESLSNLERPPVTVAKKSSLSVLFIAIIVFVLIGGAGFGVWFLINKPADASSKTFESGIPGTNQQYAPQGSPASGGSEPALVVFSELTPKAILDIVNSNEMKLIQAGANVQVIEESVSSSLLPTENLVRSVTSFLESVHVGAFRVGDSPRVMLSGESFLQGDIVEDRSRLSFVGAVGRRLVFRDKNGTIYIKSF